MKIFNTMSRTKEEFIPLKEGQVSIYACGPTVYNLIHIGNARPICVFDTLRRYLKYKGYKVTFVQNFTDIDDKIINKANEEGTTFNVVAERYIKEFMVDTKGLGVRPPDIAPKATETIDEIIALVQRIVDSGYGYEKNGDVYFRSLKFDHYGKLSGQPLDELQLGLQNFGGRPKGKPTGFCTVEIGKAGRAFFGSLLGAKVAPVGTLSARQWWKAFRLKH